MFRLGVTVDIMNDRMILRTEVRRDFWKMWIEDLWNKSIILLDSMNGKTGGLMWETGRLSGVNWKKKKDIFTCCGGVTVTITCFKSNYIRKFTKDGERTETRRALTEYAFVDERLKNSGFHERVLCGGNKWAVRLEFGDVS